MIRFTVNLFLQLVETTLLGANAECLLCYYDRTKIIIIFLFLQSMCQMLKKEISSTKIDFLKNVVVVGIRSTFNNDQRTVSMHMTNM